MKKVFIPISILFISLIVVLFNTKNVNFLDKTKDKIITYNGYNLKVSIDGIVSDSLPTSGNYYLSNYDCKSNNTKVTWDKTNYKLSVSNGNKKAGVACYLEFETNPKLSNMEVGSYVAYTGNNGCSGERCSGQNVNYASENELGGCGGNGGEYEDYMYSTNGWRIMYKANGSAYLVSGGAIECLCSNSSGTFSNDNADSTCVSGDYLSASNVYLFLNELNRISLLYCNANYVQGGVCDINTTWPIKSADVEKVIDSTVLNCYLKYGDSSCGYYNDLINNGAYYWLSDERANKYGIFAWTPYTLSFTSDASNFLNGVRPIIYLDSNVVVTGGDGTYESPYTIGNNTFSIDEASVVSGDNPSITLNLMTVGAEKMCISTNTSVCTNYIDYSDTHTLDMSNMVTGENIIYVYYKNASGNIIASINRTITLS